MSQAEALLNSLANTAYVSNDNLHIVIGNDRFIVVPESLKRIAVQYDHNVETVTFDCPRFWDNHDMSQMKIYINYMLPNGKPGQCLAKNISVNGRTMSFDWTITNQVTQYKGNLSFLVCIKKTDADGNEENHWNSELNRDCYISEGIETTQAIITKHPDIITQLLTRMDDVEAIATPEAMQGYTNTWLEENHDRALAEIEAKGVETLASIPEDYTVTSYRAEEAVRTKSDAIVCSAEGESINISDSSDDYVRGLKVFGKTTQVNTRGYQLFDYASKYRAIGAKMSDDTSEITLPSGSPSDLIYAVPYGELDAGVYYISAELGTANRMRLEVFELLADGTDSKIADTSLTAGNAKLTLTLESTKNIAIKIYTLTASSDTVVNGSFKNLLISTDVNATWEPYSGCVASPSPEWPQELNNIGSEGDVNLYFNGNNFFNPYNASNISPTTTVGEDGWVTVDIPANTNNQFSNLFTPSDGRIIVGREYVIKCEVKEITNGSLHYMSVHTEAGGSSQFHKTYSADKAGTFKTVATAVYSPSEASYMLRGYFGIADSTTAARCVYRIWVYPAELGDIEYEPYDETQAIVLSHTLPGIPVTYGGNYTDSNGQQWICDEIDFERGARVQRISTVNLADVTGWTKGADDQQTANTNLFYGHIMDREPGLLNLLCNKLPVRNVLTDANDFIGICGYTNGLLFYVRIEGQYTLDEFRGWLQENEVVVSYQLATPIETPLTADELTAFKSLHTNYPNTTVLNDAGAWMSIKYNADTKTYIDNRITSMVAAYMKEVTNGTS